MLVGGESERTACAELEVWEGQEKLVLGTWRIGNVTEGFKRRLPCCEVPCVSVRSLDFILTCSTTRKITEMNNQGNQKYCVGLLTSTDSIPDPLKT